MRTYDRRIATDDLMAFTAAADLGELAFVGVYGTSLAAWVSDVAGSYAGCLPGVDVTCREMEVLEQWFLDQQASCVC